MPNFHFDYKFTDEQLRRDFERFINNNLPEIFSDGRLATKNYSISYTEARSIVNQGGKDRDRLTSLANEIKTPSGNNSPYAPIHIAQTLVTLHGIANGSWRKFINQATKFRNTVVQNDYKYNIVWYSEFREIATTF